MPFLITSLRMFTFLLGDTVDMANFYSLKLTGPAVHVL